MTQEDTEAEQRVPGGGVGRIAMAYGQGTFGVAWSKAGDGVAPSRISRWSNPEVTLSVHLQYRAR